MEMEAEWQQNVAKLLPAIEAREQQQLQTLRETARTHWM
jgi:hypothetical protein